MTFEAAALHRRGFAPIIAAMQMFTRHDLTLLFRSLADRMVAEQDYLAELDGEIGDADHGVAMSGGFSAAAKALSEGERDAPALADGMLLAARALLNEIGATTGPLYASALMRAAQALGPQDKIPLTRLPEVIVAMSEGIAARGSSKPGDKTMIDAWAPAAHVARAGLAADQEVDRVLADAASAAAKGAEATRAMMASKGRAARLGPRSLGHVDPGAASAAALLDSMALWVADRSGRASS